ARVWVAALFFGRTTYEKADSKEGRRADTALLRSARRTRQLGDFTWSDLALTPETTYPDPPAPKDAAAPKPSPAGPPRMDAAE
ncbi:MAG: hypothetical protein AAGJ96_11710, partial [Pseudomonadota bacterium]